MNYESRKNDINDSHFINSIRGVSFVELILVVAIILLVAVSGFSLSSSFLTRNNLTNDTNELVSSFRTAQLNAISGKVGGRWGVNVDMAK